MQAAERRALQLEHEALALRAELEAKVCMHTKMPVKHLLQMYYSHLVSGFALYSLNHLC